MKSNWSRARRASRPGQACVFYDAPSGQARVLGGGFIKSATAKAASACAKPLAPRPLVEAVRG